MSEFALVLATLRQVRGLSPFFALDVGAPDAGWRDGAALLDGSALPATVARIAARYRTPEPRVAASLFFLSYTARLLSPVVAALAVGGTAPDVRPANLWWRYDDDGLRVRVKEPVGGPVGGPGIVEALAPVVAALRSVAPVAPGLLWGNAASSAAGALRVVARSGAADAGACVRLGEELFAEPPLRGAGEFVPFPGEVAFRRRSCCLYYRLGEGAGKCGDCALL